MRIQHNITAMNSYRNYTNNANKLSKNLEKLSSGYKINRAGDDAAGLAISEKMRSQITGLNAAQKNVKDGISLVKTAEGALQEVHDMLNRMTYLATQSANGTYDNAVDRDNLQKELNALRTEVDRIADSSNFNGKKLLDGSLSQAKVELANVNGNGAATGVTSNPAVAGSFTAAAASGSDGDPQKLTINYTTADGKAEKAVVEYKAAATTANNMPSIVDALKADAKFSAAFDVSLSDDKDLVLTAKTAGTQGETIINIQTDDATDTALNGINAGTAAADPNSTTDLGRVATAGDKFTLNGKTYEFVASEKDEPTTKGATAVLVGKTAADSVKNLQKALEGTGVKVESVDGQNYTFSSEKNGANLTLQIGDTADDFNQLKVQVGDMHAAALGIADVNIGTQEGAQAAVELIKNAINSVSSTRGDLGALQNRLEHTNNNLAVMEENIQDAESTIRDTDVADEMTEYTKNNILLQSAQAMLAQANQLPQGVLQLLG